MIVDSTYLGNWEVRVAFTNFSWTYDGQDVPIAFPAVRGQVYAT